MFADMPVPRYLTAAQARRIARQFEVKLPRIGYEVCLSANPRAWLQSTGHAQFGWFGSTATQPFAVMAPQRFIDSLGLGLDKR